MLPYVGAGFIAVLVLGVLGFLTYSTIAILREARLQAAEHTTPWTAYCEPNRKGQWEIGVQRAWNGHTFDRVPTIPAPLPADTADTALYEARATAEMAAARYNQLRTDHT